MNGKKIIIPALMVLIMLLSLAFMANIAAGQQKIVRQHARRVQASLLTNGMRRQLAANFQLIEDQNLPVSLLEPELTDLKASVQVIGLDGTVIFSSSGNTGFTIDLSRSIHEEPFIYPLFSQNSLVAYSLFSLPDNIFPAERGFRAILPQLLPLFIIWLLIWAAYFLLQRSYRRQIRDPLRQLTAAAAQLGHGNYQHPIEDVPSALFEELVQALDRLRVELVDAMRRQSELDQSRQDLITRISHELRTPVAAIKAYAEGMRDGIDTDAARRRRYIEVILRKSASLSGLIDDLFEQTLAQAGKLRVEPGEFYSRQLFSGIISALFLQYRDSAVSMSCAADIPDVLIRADPGRLEQVMQNLVQNSVKYTPAGGRIEIAFENQPDLLSITVSDTGYGIEPQDLLHIFDPFFRGRAFRSRDFEGAGLGLNICRNIIEQHGGRISVRSRPDAGSSFTFTLPKV